MASRPRVADIVAAAGLSNDAFYRHFPSKDALLRESFARLGSTAPDLDASLAANAVVGKISDYLWQRTTPTPADLDQITAFCLRAATPASVTARSAT